MDWTALWLSLRLAGLTVVFLLPLGIPIGAIFGGSLKVGHAVRRLREPAASP